MASPWYALEGHTFYATCPFTGRKVHGADARSLKGSVPAVDITPPKAADCPFCPGNELTQLPELVRFDPERPHWRYYQGANELSQPWRTRAFPNLYKHEREPNEHILWRMQHYRTLPQGSEHLESLLQKYGPSFQTRKLNLQEPYFFDPSHVVIVSTPEHSHKNGDSASIATMASEDVLYALQTALNARDLSQSLDDRLCYGYIYKNHGPFGGASQSHEHLQLRCYEDYSYSSKLYQHLLASQKNPLIMEDILDFAMQRDWLITATEEALAFTVPWEEFPGLWVVPTSRFSRFSAETLTRGVTDVLQTAIKGLHALHETSYNFGLFDSTRDHFLQPHIKLILRTKLRGGTDILFGPENHPLTPELFAQQLREASATLK